MEHVARGELHRLAASMHTRTGLGYPKCVERVLAGRPDLHHLTSPANGADPVQVLAGAAAVHVKGGLREDAAVARAREEHPTLALAVSRLLVHPHTREAAQERWRTAWRATLDGRSPSPISKAQPTSHGPEEVIPWNRVRVARLEGSRSPISEERERLTLLARVMAGSTPQSLNVLLEDHGFRQVHPSRIDWAGLKQALVARGLASWSSF